MTHRGVIGALLLILAWPSGSPAQIASTGRVPFVVDPATIYEEGCMNGLCLCPVFTLDGVRGRFTLVPTRPEQQRQVYEVRDLRFVLPDAELGPEEVIGFGTYWIDHDAREQQMQLELSFDGAPAREFDSGVMPLDTDGIHLDLRSDESFCYGYSFGMAAVRMQRAISSGIDPSVRPKQARETVTWATLKSRYH